MNCKQHMAMLMSTEVGLKTQYLNWRENLPLLDGIDPVWITVDWWNENGSIENLPGIPNGVKARLRAHWELSKGFKKGPFDALLLASSVTLPGGNRFLKKQPFFVMLDITPKQMADLGEIYDKPERKIPFLHYLKLKIWRWRFLNAIALFPWSQWAADSMITDYGADPQKIHVVPPGINLVKWNFVDRTQRNGDVRILFVGGGFKRKGGDLLLEWAQKTKMTGWVLDMVTRDCVTPPNEQVRIHNGLDQDNPKLRELYEQADIFVLPTLGDCYSLASLEAMATGLPVIVSAVGGIPDIIREGETGFLITIGDEEALANRLEYMITQPKERLRMGCNARKDVEEKWDAKKNIEYIITEINRLLHTLI